MFKKKIQKCVYCGDEKVAKCLVFGLPLKLCDECKTAWGIGAYLLKYSGGRVMQYRCGYFRALWHFLAGTEC